MPDKRPRASKDEVKNLGITRVTDGEGERLRDIVVREFPLTIVLNGTELVTLLCTPTKLKELAAGFLFSEGLLRKKGDIKRIALDGKRGVAWVETKMDEKVNAELLARRYITTGCGKGTSFMGAEGMRSIPKIRSDLKIAPSSVLALMDDFQKRSDIHRMTGGVHNAALCDKKKIMIFSEDIGRHSAIDKIIGECLLKGVKMKDRLMITSGRVSSEVMLKTAMAGIPMIVSKSAPTDLGVKLAEQSGVTLIGFARGRRMNLYANGWRITSSPRPS